MTRPSFRTVRVPVLTLALTLALAGCGGSDTPTDAPENGEPELGPLDEFFERAYGSFDEDQMVREMHQVEEAVAECMAEEGFEYVPVDQSQGVSMSSDELDVDWGSREFAEEYGYGITTNPWGDSEEAMPLEEEFVDPNMEYVEAMSETEREAYYLALYGDQTFSEDPEEVVEYDWEQNGCQGRAQHEVQDVAAEDPALVSLEEEMNSLWERTSGDPRVSEANAAWTSCMADAGFAGLATVEDAQTRFVDDSNAVYDEAYAGAGEGTEFSEADFLAIEAQVEERLAELADEEIRAAVADYDCREKVRYDDTLTSVSHELQKEFVDTHREELDAWVEAVSGGRS